MLLAVFDVRNTVKSLYVMTLHPPPRFCRLSVWLYFMYIMSSADILPLVSFLVLVVW